LVSFTWHFASFFLLAYIVEEYVIHLFPSFSLLSILVFPGLAAAGDPNFKTFEAAYPFVVQKLITENSAATRKILHSVLHSF
jgi:aarF domain-containing kinase